MKDASIPPNNTASQIPPLDNCPQNGSPSDQSPPQKKKSRLRTWIHRGFLAWGVFVTLFMLNMYRTKGVDPQILMNDSSIRVVNTPESLAFLPVETNATAGLVFFCGAGPVAKAYAPLLRPIAEQGYAVYIVKLPLRVAPFEGNKKTALERARSILANNHPPVYWVVAGHSLGAVLASRMAQNPPVNTAAFVLVGTTHPRDFNLSQCPVPFTKVFGSNDNIAPVAKVEANRKLLPPGTTWIEIEGANHAQFAHYGPHLGDGKPTISREQQQAQTRQALLDALESIQ